MTERERSACNAIFRNLAPQFRLRRGRLNPCPAGQDTHFNSYLIPFYGFPDLVIRSATSVQLLAKSELILIFFFLKNSLTIIMAVLRRVEEKSLRYLLILSHNLERVTASREAGVKHCAKMFG